MYCAPIFPEQIAPLGLVIATTMSIEEFLRPSREIRLRIITLSERVDRFTRSEQRRNSQLRSTNEFSRKISSFLRRESTAALRSHNPAKDVPDPERAHIYLHRESPGACCSRLRRAASPAPKRPLRLKY